MVKRLSFRRKVFIIVASALLGMTLVSGLSIARTQHDKRVRGQTVLGRSARMASTTPSR